MQLYMYSRGISNGLVKPQGRSEWAYSGKGEGEAVRSQPCIASPLFLPLSSKQISDRADLQSIDTQRWEGTDSAPPTLLQWGCPSRSTTIARHLVKIVDMRA